MVPLRNRARAGQNRHELTELRRLQGKNATMLIASLSRQWQSLFPRHASMGTL